MMIIWIMLYIQAGLARLFNSLRLYDSSFNSLQLHVRPVIGDDGIPTGGN
jgi:hypothetical protein